MGGTNSRPETTPDLPVSVYVLYPYHERLTEVEFSKMFPPLLYPGQQPDSRREEPTRTLPPGLFAAVFRTARQSQSVAATVLENPPADQPSCSVCLMNVSCLGPSLPFRLTSTTRQFQPNDRVRLLSQCDHIFHDGCVKKWMVDRKSQCPVCRYDYGNFRIDHDGTIILKPPKPKTMAAENTKSLPPFLPSMDKTAKAGASSNSCPTTGLHQMPAIRRANSDAGSLTGQRSSMVEDQRGSWRKLVMGTSSMCFG